MCDNNGPLENAYTTGIIGSLIASFLTMGIIRFKKYYILKLKHSKFKDIFGSYKNDRLNLVLPALQVRSDVMTLVKTSRLQDADFPLLKVGGSFVRASKLIPYSDTIALKYLLDLISSTLGDKAFITTDEDLLKHLNLSFISFGGTSFYCSYVLGQPDNKFYYFNGNDIVSKANPLNRFTNGNGIDYGLIIKYKHKEFSKRTWIIIAGLGETGTSGAAWYLATHWKEISKIFKNKSFGIIVKVDNGIDESAKIVDQIV